MFRKTRAIDIDNAAFVAGYGHLMLNNDDQSHKRIAKVVQNIVFNGHIYCTRRWNAAPPNKTERVNVGVISDDAAHGSQMSVY